MSQLKDINNNTESCIIYTHNKNDFLKFIQTLPQTHQAILKKTIKTKSQENEPFKKITLPTDKANITYLIPTSKLPTNTQDFHSFIDKILKAIPKSCKEVHYTFQNKKNTPQEVKYFIQQISQHFYEFTLYKSSPKNPTNRTVLLYTSEPNKEIKNALTQGKAIHEGLTVSKDLAHQPGNICTPKTVTQTVKSYFKDHKYVKVQSLNTKQMQDLGMNALLSVAQGSINEPYCLILHYTPQPKKPTKIALIGKGVTFDSGGISIKPSANMHAMKYDMCGATTVIGTLAAISKARISTNLIIAIPLVENMPSHQSNRPGDVVTSLSGKTVEILNTDAEGRLILCDAITYIQKQYKPEIVIDLATLTGACVVALGHHTTALYSNNSDLAESLIKSSENSNDPAWRMPLSQRYHDQLKSSIADFANIATPGGGSITAACFLEKFIEDNVCWAHLDIAGTAFTNQKASGRPLPLLFDYCAKQSL